MMKKGWVFRRGDIYLADLGKPCGSEQGGVRVVVVLQNNLANYYSPTITIAPLSSIKKKEELPTHYLLKKAPGLKCPSMVMAEQLETRDKKCIIRYLGRVTTRQMIGIDEAVKAHLGYYIPENSSKNRYTYYYIK